MRQIDQRTTKQIRIDSGMHRLLKLKATEANKTIKEFLEGYLSELLAVEGKLC